MNPPNPQFERVRELGAGATARVDLVKLVEPLGELAAGAEVARKTLLPELRDDARALAAFRAEAEAGRRVAHPSLAAVLFDGTAGDDPCILMPFVPGSTLSERLAADGPLPEPLVRSVGEQLAGALAALHDAGLVHGDLKLENVRLDSEGRAVLLDLGFTRAVRTDDNPDAGSLAYLCPERAQGRAASTASDVFALGIVLYELCTGLHPFGSLPEGPAQRVSAHGASSGAVLRRSIEVPGADALLAAIATARFVPPSRFAPRLTPFVDTVLQRCLARDPADRPTAGELEPTLAEGESGTWWRAQLDAPAEARRSLGGLSPRLEPHLTPLVGRERELGRLDDLLHRVARESRGAAVWLVGPVGSGKWRLVDAFAGRARLSARPPVYLYARWTEVAESRPAGALLILLHRWLQLPPGRAPGPREERLLGGLVTPDEVRSLCAALDPSPEVRHSDSVAFALASWLVALSAKSALLVFLDDLHRAGEVTLGALSAVIDRLDRAAVLLVLGLREEVSSTNPDAFEQIQALVERTSGEASGIASERLELGAISQEAVRDLTDQVFHRSAPRLRLAVVLWERSGGNPGLIAEILRTLVARGHAHAAPDDEPGLVLTITPEELPLPESLDKLIHERYAALDAELARWVGRLSVVGGRLEPEFLCRAFPPTSRAEIDDVLSALVREEWLVPAGNRYRFARPALRRAVYRSLPPERRVRLHAAAARGMASEVDGAPSPEESFQRAFHLRAARQHADVLELVLALVHDLRRRASAQRMEVLARWGLEALDGLVAEGKITEPESVRLELLEVAADAADRLGNRGEEREFLDRLVELDIDPERNAVGAARLYLLHGRYAAGTGQFGLARGMLRNAVQIAETAGNPGLWSEALRRLSVVQGQIGELVEARELAEHAFEVAASPVQRGLAHLAIATVDALEDRFEDGLNHVDACLRELRDVAVPHLGVLGYAHLVRARLLRSAGRPARALGAARRAVRLARRSGERRFEVEARARLGMLLLDLDRADEAEAHLRDALYSSREIEDRRGQTLATLLLGILLWEADEPTAGAEIERGTHLAREIGFYRAEAVGLAILARIHRARGDLDRADRASLRASELVQLHGAEMADRIAILATRAFVLHAIGRSGEARALVKELERRIRLENARIRAPDIRRGQREYSSRLLEAVLSPEGPVYPRLTD